MFPTVPIQAKSFLKPLPFINVSQLFLLSGYHWQCCLPWRVVQIAFRRQCPCDWCFYNIFSSDFCMGTWKVLSALTPLPAPPLSDFNHWGISLRFLKDHYFCSQRSQIIGALVLNSSLCVMKEKASTIMSINIKHIKNK